MKYTKLAVEFIHNYHNLIKHGHKDEAMRGEYYALIYLSHDYRDFFPSDISDEMNISSARVAAMLNNLEKKGLVMRKKNPDDRRKTIVVITEKGKEMAKKIETDVMNHVMGILKHLGEDDAKEFVRIMGKLNTFFED